MNYNIWNKWDPIEVCMLGNNYLPEFFNGLPDKTGDPLKRICEETLEDLQGFKTIMEDFGIEVIQPDMDPLERFLDNPKRYPRGPLQPRDEQLVIADKCFTSRQDHPAIHKKLVEYNSTNTIFTDTLPLPPHKYNEIMCNESGDWPPYEDYANGHKLKDFVVKEIDDLNYQCLCLNSANTFQIDKKLVVGNAHSDGGKMTENVDGFLYFLKKYTGVDFEIQLAPMEGHTDANFHPIKPGVILSLKDVQTYSKTFPGWDVCYLPEQSWKKVKGFRKLKSKNSGKWYLAGEEDNDEFIEFVETWLHDWLGYVEETVFDVNVLMLDESHCCVSNANNKQVKEFLKKHRINPVPVPFRHRYFWDGGLHCITLDLKRKGD